MKRLRWFLMVLVVFAAGTALAQDEEKKTDGAAQTPEDVTVGEIRLSLSSDYVKLKVDGEDWEEHEYLDNGKTLVIHTIRRLDDHEIALTPTYGDLAPQTLVVKPADWKLVKIGKNEKMWRAEKKIVFAKAPKTAPAPAPAPAPATAPEPAPAGN